MALQIGGCPAKNVPSIRLGGNKTFESLNVPLIIKAALRLDKDKVMSPRQALNPTIQDHTFLDSFPG